MAVRAISLRVIDVRWRDVHHGPSAVWPSVDLTPVLHPC